MLAEVSEGKKRYGRDDEELLSSRPWWRKPIPLPGVVDREGEGDGMDVVAREGNPKLHGHQGGLLWRRRGEGRSSTSMTASEAVALFLQL